MILVSFVGVLVGFIVFNIGDSNHSPPKGKICLVIDDFGYAINDTIHAFMQLDESITLAIIPGHNYSKQVGEIADSLGIETIIHLPMEPNDYDGISEKEYILTDKLNAEEVSKRVNSAFEEIPTAKGMNNHQGSRATENLQLMKDLARSLKAKNKFFLDSFTNPESRAFITMRRYGVKTELRQVFLDHIETSQHIESQLDSLRKLSHIMEVAIGIGHVKHITLSQLQKFIPKYKKMGYEKIRIRPAYFAYTEPSLEIDVFHPVHKKWLELGGAGMFRPEVTIPIFGRHIPVLAWGQGFDRIITDFYNITDLRELYKNDINKLREMKFWGK